MYLLLGRATTMVVASHRRVGRESRLFKCEDDNEIYRGRRYDYNKTHSASPDGRIQSHLLAAMNAGGEEERFLDRWEMGFGTSKRTWWEMQLFGVVEREVGWSKPPKSHSLCIRSAKKLG